MLRMLQSSKELAHVRISVFQLAAACAEPADSPGCVRLGASPALHMLQSGHSSLGRNSYVSCMGYRAP
jgi:hypothetical protein